MHMWNWQKIEVNGKQTNLPKFNENVILYEYKDNTHFVIIGYLDSIDGNGLHWKPNTNNFFDIQLMFGMQKSNDVIKPTHWCVIEPPIN